MIDEQKLVDLYFRSYLHPDLNRIFRSCIESEVWENFIYLGRGDIKELLDNPKKTHEVLEIFVVAQVFCGEGTEPLKILCREIFKRNIEVHGYVMDNFPEFVDVIRFWATDHFYTILEDERKLFYSPAYNLTSDIYEHPQKYAKYLPGHKNKYTTEELEAMKEKKLPREMSEVVSLLLNKKKKKKE